MTIGGNPFVNPIPLATLVVAEDKATLYKAALMIATGIGVPVSTWQDGDPTRSLLFLEAEVLERLSAIIVALAQSAFLDDAPDDWLVIVAKQFFNVDVPEASYATTDVVLTNNGGGLYDEQDLAVGNVTFRNSLTNKTYHNITTGVLASGPGTTLTLTIEADEAGSESTAGAGEIDEMVTVLLGVACTNPIAAVGSDRQDRSTTIQQCRDKISSLSPNGPSGAYAFVARNAVLTGTTAITRVRTFGSSDTGDVLVVLAGASGAVAEVDRAKVEAAVLKWSTPLCITPSVISSSNVVIAITYEVWIYKRVNKTVAEIHLAHEKALAAMMAAALIGGDITTEGVDGVLYQSEVETAIKNAFPKDTYRVVVSVPGDTSLSNDQVPVLGEVTSTINLIVDPK